MVVNDPEQGLISKDIAGLYLDYFKLFILMSADDIVSFLETDDGLQNGIHCVYMYAKMEAIC